nr:hypothetical protein KXZ65_15175 [Pectobacterium sp. PL152]
MRRKIPFPAQNGVRQFMRAGRPYCLAHGGNVAAGRHAKTPNVKAAHRRTLRATTPFETPFLAHFFFCPFRSAKKWENAFKVGSRASLPACGRRLSHDGVRGLSPPNKPTRGRVFLLAGAAKFIRLPPACSVSLGETLAGGFGRRKLAISVKLNLLASRHG